MSKESKAQIDGPGLSNPEVKEQAARLDPDVAGHEDAFVPKDELPVSAVANRAEADAQIAANAADHPQGPVGDLGPETDQPEAKKVARKRSAPKK